MNQNIVKSGTAQKLINSTYLHSNTDNFVEVAQEIRKFQLNPENKKLQELLDKLKKIIISTNNDVNDMYADLGILDQDSCVFNNDNIDYTPAGARVFRENFLIKNFLTTNRNVSDYTNTHNFNQQKILLTIINSEESLEALQMYYTQILDEMKDTIIEEAEINEIKNSNIYQQLVSLTGTYVRNFTIQNLRNFLGRVFQNRSKNNKTMLRLVDRDKKVVKDVNIISDLLTELGIEIDKISLTNSKDIKKIQTAIDTALIKKMTYRRLGERYYDNFLIVRYRQLVKDFYKQELETLDINTQNAIRLNRGHFIQEFENTLKEYPSIDLSLSSNSSTVKGFTLEFGFMISQTIFLNSKIVQILGQNIETRYYKTTQKKHNSSINSNFSIKSQSASDIVFQGTKGEYRLQLKNNLIEGQQALSFRAQPEIKISTFLPTAIEDIDIRDQLSYLLINTAYLSKYGLSKYGEDYENKLKTSNFPWLQQYIEFLLSQGYKFILGNEYRVDEGMFKGNVAYIFQGKFLIPVTAFFVSAYQLLIILQKKVDSLKSLQSAIGGLPMPTFSGLSDNTIENNNLLGISNKEFQERKINLINKLKTPDVDAVYGVYKYPQHLLEYGNSYGIKVYNDLKFRLRITLIIDKIIKLL